MVKNILKLFSILAILVLLPLVILSVLNTNSDFADTLEANWGVVLSEQSGWKLEYHADEGASFHGDGIRYNVISYTQEDEIANMVAWCEEEGVTRRSRTYQEEITLWLDDIGVDTGYCPEYQGCKYWYQLETDGSEIILVWNAELDKVYIAESFY